MWIHHTKIVICFINKTSHISDINECDSDLHTCHPSAQCVNTDGGFICKCLPDLPCKLSCMFEEAEIQDGIAIPSKKDPCEICSCNKGVMKCEKPKWVHVLQ